MILPYRCQLGPVLQVKEGTRPTVPSWAGKGFAHIGVLVLIILIPVVGPVALLSRVPEPFDDPASGGQAGAGRGEHGDGITNSTELRLPQLCSSGAFSFHVTPTVSAHVLWGGRAQTGGRLPAFLLRKGEHLQKTEALSAQGCSRPWGAPPRKAVSHHPRSSQPHLTLFCNRVSLCCPGWPQ